MRKPRISPTTFSLSSWQKIKTYKHRGHPFSSWLYQIARNQVIDHYRSRKSDISLDKLDPESSIIPAAANFDLSAKLQLEKVYRAIKELKPDYQDVIIMRFVEDLPPQGNCGGAQKVGRSDKAHPTPRGQGAKEEIG